MSHLIWVICDDSTWTIFTAGTVQWVWYCMISYSIIDTLWCSCAVLQYLIISSANRWIGNKNHKTGLFFQEIHWQFVNTRLRYSGHSRNWTIQIDGDAQIDGEGSEHHPEFLLLHPCAPRHTITGCRRHSLPTDSLCKTAKSWPANAIQLPCSSHRITQWLPCTIESFKQTGTPLCSMEEEWRNSQGIK